MAVSMIWRSFLWEIVIGALLCGVCTMGPDVHCLLLMSLVFFNKHFCTFGVDARVTNFQGRTVKRSMQDLYLYSCCGCKRCKLWFLWAQKVQTPYEFLLGSRSHKTQYIALPPQFLNNAVSGPCGLRLL